MQTHELFQHDPLRPEDRKRCRPPSYDKEPGKPSLILSADGESIFQIVQSKVAIVPLLERESRDLSDLAMALISASLMECSKPSLEARSKQDAIRVGRSALSAMDLGLDCVLVKTGSEFPAVDYVKIAHHPDVDPDVVICFPEPACFGFMPTVDDQSFGMMVHNPGAAVQVKIVRE